MSILPAWLESFAFNHHKLWKWYVSLCGGYMKYVSWHQTYKLAVYLFLFSQFCFNVVIEWKFIWKWHNCFWKILLLVYLEREGVREREREMFCQWAIAQMRAIQQPTQPDPNRFCWLFQLKSYFIMTKSNRHWFKCQNQRTDLWDSL